MKAIVQDRYGTADVLEFRDIEEPVVGADDVLVRVRAAGCGPDVWHFMAGMPYIARASIGLRGPKVPVRGWDVAGTVEAVGANVTRFAPGDEVMGTAEQGSFAELASTPADKLVAQAGGADLRRGRRAADLGRHRPAGRARRGTGAGRPACARHRRLWRRGFARRADREGVRRDGHRRLQHGEGRSRALARGRRRDRLHARGLHRRIAAVGPDHRHGRSAPVVDAAARPHREGHPRDRGRRRRRPVDRWLLPRHAAGAARVAVRGTAAARARHQDRAGRPRRPDAAGRSRHAHER